MELNLRAFSQCLFSVVNTGEMNAGLSILRHYIALHLKWRNYSGTNCRNVLPKSRVSNHILRGKVCALSI
jgi:hypothetical protein